jgi:hypothetical protein
MKRMCALSITALSLCWVAAPSLAQSTPLGAGVGMGFGIGSGVATAPTLGAREMGVPAKAPETNGASDEGCTLGQLCFGPMVTLGAIDLLGVGVHLRYGRYLGFGVDYQFLPTRIDIEQASATWSLLTVEGRAYPFANAFFLSAGFGYQSFAATVREMTGEGLVSMSGSLGVPALKLGIGFVGKSGFVLGADVGFNVLLGDADVQFDEPTGPAAMYQTAAISLRAEINDIANQAMDEIPVIPQINFIRMGYLF